MIRACLISLLFLTLACTSSSKKGDSAGGGFKIRKFDTEKMENGLTIVWIKDQSLPYVSMQMLVKSGSGQDSVGKEGVASFTGAMLDRGTAKRDAVKISEDLEQFGSSFNVSVQPDYTMASTSTLSFHKDAILAQFAEILLTPSFPQVEIDRQRKLLLAGLLKLADRPEEFSEYLLPRFMFGGHPYGHDSSGTPGSVRGFKKADLETFYARHYTPGNSILAVVGQYDDGWKQSVKQAFSGWKSKSTQDREIPEFPAWKGTELLLVDRADLNQAQIQVGFKGVPRDIPEYLELRAALKILGESFGSRLFEEIREKRGLTYHIRAWFDPRMKTGPMGIYTFTRLDKIGETVEETLKTYRDFVKNGITDDELKEVKALMRGQFPRTFETPESLSMQLLLLNLYGISIDYLANYLPNVDALTKEDINKTIVKYFDPANLKILVYAPRGQAELPMSKLGKVQVRDYKEFLR